MFDNMTIDKPGRVFLQEDVGNQEHNGKIWMYNIATDTLELVAQHDPARFGDLGVPATAPFNQDEESSGIIDGLDILGEASSSATSRPTTTRATRNWSRAGSSLRSISLPARRNKRKTRHSAG